MNLRDKVAIITGAATGIGEATAILLAKKGAKVAVADYNEKEGNDTVEQIKKEGNEAFFVKTDVSKENEVKNFVNKTVKKYGLPDILHNNAGVNPVEGSVVEATSEDFDRIINTNLRGYFLCSKHTIPKMIENGGGVIINTASVMGLAYRGYKGNALYAASKGAIVILTKCMALDHEADNIRVNAVAPGLIDTPLADNWLKQQENPAELTQHIGDPSDIAHAVLYLISDEASWVNGTILTVDGGETLS